MNCKNCHSDQVIKNGFVRSKPRYRCQSCGYDFVPNSSTDKTLISWFCFDEQPSKPCSVVSLQAVDDYDALAFGQDAPGKWSTASNDNIRTQTQEQLAQNPAQEIVLGEFMMMAAVYQDKMVTIYREGEVYASYTIEKLFDFLGSPYLQLVIGPIKLSPSFAESFKGKIKDVRIYAQALTQEEIKSLKPNEPSSIRPFSWYDFSRDGWAEDQTGRFPEIKNGGARKENPEDGYVIFDQDNRYLQYHGQRGCTHSPGFSSTTDGGSDSPHLSPGQFRRRRRQELFSRSQFFRLLERSVSFWLYEQGR